MKLSNAIKKLEKQDGNRLIDMKIEEEMQRYDEDAKLLIKKLAQGKIGLKHGKLNHVGVDTLIRRAYEMIRKRSIAEIMKEVD